MLSCTMVIHPKHPDPNSNILQEKLLASLPDSQKHAQVLFFSYANAVCHYHARSTDFKPSETDYQEWLEGLPEPIQLDMKKKGFEGCKTVLSFTRYVMEKNDIGQDEYVKQLMGEAAFNEFMASLSYDAED